MRSALKRVARTCAAFLVAALLLPTSIALPTLRIGEPRAAWAAGASAELERLFPRAARVLFPPGAEGSLFRLELPSGVLAECRPDVSDVRLLDERGEQVPFVIDRGPERPSPARVRRVPAELLGANRQERPRPQASNVIDESYELRVPPAPPAGSSWALSIETPEAHFVRQMVVSRVGPGGAREELVRASVFRLKNGSELLRAALPTVLGERLAVQLVGEGRTALEPRFVFEAIEPSPAERVAEVPLEREPSLTGDRTPGDRERIVLARPSGIVPSALRVATRTAAFERRVEVEDEVQGSAPRVVGKGTVFRLPGLAPIEQLDIPIDGVLGQRLSVTVHNGDSPALESLELRALVRTPSLLFVLPARGDGSRSATLFFGGGRAHAPRYDLDALLRRARLEPASVGLGPLEPNARFDARPALDFALRPGAPVDPRLFTHQRALELAPSHDGLARVSLSAADLAVLREDRADVRVVDASGQQWPYVLDTAEHSERVPLGIGSAARDGRWSRRSFSLPLPYVTADALLLDASETFFDRAYRVLGEAVDGRAALLGSGRLARGGAREGDPLVLELQPTRVRSLTLEVEDGDDAPLSWRSVHARVPVPRLYVLAKPGSYRLLLGNPALTAPSYDVERARALVLSVASRDGVPGPLTPNPAYSTSARLASGGGPTQVLLWGALALAIVVLGGITLRLGRGLPKAP